MIITALVENETVSKEYINKHGLSLYIKTDEHNILFDVGPDDTFIRNAEKLNIDLKDVDIVVISHGHNDHGGGLNEFLKYNSKAKVYIRKAAFEPHYSSHFKIVKHYIGLDQTIKDNERIIFTDDRFNIDENLCLFSNVERIKLCPQGNNTLLKKKNKKYMKDDFIHEQNMLIYEDNNYVLLTGCSHSGIVNILEEGEKIAAKNLSVVVGGFHLFEDHILSEQFLAMFTDELGKRKTKFYTCHCTGIKAYNLLRKNLNDQIEYFKTGQILDIENTGINLQKML